jgi:hypothetical protein
MEKPSCQGIIETLHQVITFIFLNVDAMAVNQEINRRLCRFPESSVSYTALRTAVAKALADQQIAASFLPLLKQVGFGKHGRKRVPRDEDGKPIIEDTISDTFSF